jgi:hypothetical protein
LEREAAQALNLALESLAEDVQQLSTRIGDGVLPWVTRGDYPGLSLCRRGWFDDAAVRTRAHIRLEWLPKHVSLTHSNRPYTGVRVDLGLPDGPALHGRLKESCADKIKEGKYGKDFGWWAGQRHVPPAVGKYWLDLSEYREQVMAELSIAWEVFSEHIDAAVQQLPSSA